MNLLIDIGNTNITVAAATDTKIFKKIIISSTQREGLQKTFKRILKKNNKKLEKIIIVSVVPDLLRLTRKTLKAVMPDVPIRIVGQDIKVPIKNRYRNPREVGQDRLVTAFAASGMYGTPLVIVDFGTAVTFDFVNNKGEYEGGLIFPGLRLGLESLVQSTALLPEIKVKSIHPVRNTISNGVQGLLGKGTKGSMNKGLLLGYAAMCDGILQRFRKRYGKKLKVVATGGDAKLIAKYSRYIKKTYPDLIFAGLGLLVT